MTDTELRSSQDEVSRRPKTFPGIGLPAGTDYPNLTSIGAEPCGDIFWRKEVLDSFEVAHNNYSFYRVKSTDAVFAKDLSGYFYRLNNSTRCFEFLFEGFKETTDYTRIILSPQAPTFVGFNYLHQPVFPMNEDGRPILPKDNMGKTIFPYFDGFPLFPVDDSGAVCVPLGDNGKPVFPRIPEEFGAYVPCDVTGRVVLPYDENGDPIYPRDEEGNVLMPFIVLEDGSKKRAVLTDDRGIPVLPHTNGEPALEVHDEEVLFQYEYQQKMMMMTHYGPAKTKNQPTNLVDEKFYQQHAFQYHAMLQSTGYSDNQNQLTVQHPVEEPQTTKKPNLLLQQLSFLKKKVDNKTTGPGSPSNVARSTVSVIPADRPDKPNKEKKLNERYIPEPSKTIGRREHAPRDRHRVSRSPLHKNSPKRKRRSRSLTWSPIEERSSRKTKKSGESYKQNTSPRPDRSYRKSSYTNRKDSKRRERSSRS